MNTLLLQLIAPMQSWGVQSLYGHRDSGLEPSKSGVVGLLCAALGRDRSESVSDLAALRMGVRVDREGKLRKDFQKAEPLNRFGQMAPDRKVTIGDRYYLADAAFLVGLEGDPALLDSLAQALSHPVYALFLGRKSFPPAAPILLPDSLYAHTPLEQALRTCGPIVRDAPVRRRVLIEDPRGEIILNDQPISYLQRRFTQRRVRQEIWSFAQEEVCTSPS